MQHGGIEEGGQAAVDELHIVGSALDEDGVAAVFECDLGGGAAATKNIKHDGAGKIAACAGAGGVPAKVLRWVSCSPILPFLASA